jgi:hypothetical protein
LTTSTFSVSFFILGLLPSIDFNLTFCTAFSFLLEAGFSGLSFLDFNLTYLTKLPSGMDSKPLQKSAENLSNINKITKINVSSTQKSTASTSTLEKSVSGTKENAVQNVKLKSIDDKPEKSALDKNENATAVVGLNCTELLTTCFFCGSSCFLTTSTFSVSFFILGLLPSIDFNLTFCTAFSFLLSSSVQFRPTTAVEARAFAGGERQNLLEEIQNFKRKPSPEAEKKLAEVKPEERKSKASSLTLKYY